MKARTSSVRRTTLRVPITKVINFAASAIIACIGLLISTPFMYVIATGRNYHHISFLMACFIALFVVGAPMLLGGLIGLVATRRAAFSSLAENDIARIRYAAETEVARRK